MSRESRHVHVLGLPDALSEERVSNFFSTFGRVQKAERLSSSGVVVSFMDVRSAQKAHSAEPKFDGHQLRITFHDQSKKWGIVSSCYAPCEPHTSVEVDLQGAIYIYLYLNIR